MILDISSIIPAIAFILYIIFTVFGLYHNREEKIRWSFILYMFVMAIWSFGSFMMHANTSFLTPLAWNRFMMVGMLGGSITIFHSLLDLSETRSRRYNILKYIGYCNYGLLLVLNFTGNIVERAWFEGTTFNYSLARGSLVAYSLGFSYLIFGIILLSRVISKAEETTLKKKLRLPLVGAVIMLGGILVNIHEPLGRYPIDLFSATLNAVFIFTAIYKFRLVHYSAIVLRTILYFVLIVISAFIFYGILWLSSRELRAIPFAYSFLISLLLGSVAAFIFQPLKRGTFSIMERLYFGKRFDYYKGLMDFSQSLTSIVDLYVLGELIIGKIVETFELKWAFMVVLDYSSRNYRVLAASGLRAGKEEIGDLVFGRQSDFVKLFTRSNGTLLRPAPSDVNIPFPGENESLEPSLVLPLRFKERVNGCIVLGPLEERDYFNQFETETLQMLADQCSISLENAISFERLKKQQKRLQDLNNELTLSRNKLEAFFDGITNPITIQDINYNIIMVNLAATRYFRHSFEDLIGKKCYRVYFGKNKPCVDCLAQDCLHTQLPFGIELVDEKTGFTFAVSYYPISVPEGSDKIFLELFQDITEQKRLQQELIQSEKLAGIGTLASGIAHEINNPLGGIIGTAEIMLDEIDPSSKLHEYTRDIITYSETAAEVVRELTNYSRKEKGEATSVDLNEVLRISLKLAQRGLNFKHIEVIEYLEQFPPVMGNQGELQQVFVNLVINAVQAMRGKGVLSIESRYIDGNAVISIRDTGQGIAEENIEKIFNPFFTTKEPGQGTGLGLSITHQIINSMGGRIHIDSTIGKGSVFIVYIPLTEEQKWKIRFRNASDPQTKEDVFYLQRKILVGEKGYLEETIRRQEDEVAFHIVAYKGLQPVGTVSCMVPEVVNTLPIEKHFQLNDLISGKRCAEIDRLAVLEEERGSIIPLGLMTLAYLFAKYHTAERVFLDVFSDEKKHISMYSKLGFQVIGEYSDPHPVAVMMLDHKTDYEKTGRQLERFVKPFLSRLVKRIDFDESTREMILSAIEQILTAKVGF